MKCRHCNTWLKDNFLDLGFAPPSNAYLNSEDLKKHEKYYPLKVKVCGNCWLVQAEIYARADELFNSEYAYFSSTSSLWLAHAKKYAENIISELTLDRESLVIEVASNDGYLLKNFLEIGIPCLGIEPTESTAVVAEELGIPVIKEFFTQSFAQDLASKGQQADLIIGNNVYAHVPNINDFTSGLKAALKPGGTVTLEFPHLLQLIKNNQFDTVYHEHFSYLSLGTVNRIFQSAGLRIWKVEQLTTHGGSLRVYGCHDHDSRTNHESVFRILSLEKREGLESMITYSTFQAKADYVKNSLLEFLIQQKNNGRLVAAYGAAAKGNTLLNYAGVKTDLISCIYDAATSKQNKFMPGSHIPILAPKMLLQQAPDFILILPWNISSEIRSQLDFLKSKGTRFLTAVPALEVDPPI